MNKLLWVNLLGCVAAGAALAAPPTFYKDVLPVLQRNCQSCHRPGEIAPMTFLTYDSTRPWAKAIKSAVLTGKMPPWFADPAVGHFSNDRTLSKADIDTLVTWTDAGAPAGNEKDAPRPMEFTEGWNIADELLDFHVPGSVPHILPEGQAKFIKAGSDLVFQMHYTASGKPAKDRTRIGIIFAKQPPRERIYTLSVVNNGFKIPPGDGNYPVEAKMTVQQNARIVALNPHMHLRGKSFEFRVVPPGGEEQVLLRVPKYDFAWQLQYYLAEPLTLAPGSRIECYAHYDNSTNNPFNPDPAKEVHWGDQSWEEMMIGTVDIAVDAKMNPIDIYRPAVPSQLAD